MDSDTKSGKCILDVDAELEWQSSESPTDVPCEDGNSLDLRYRARQDSLVEGRDSSDDDQLQEADAGAENPNPFWSAATAAAATAVSTAAEAAAMAVEAAAFVVTPAHDRREEGNDDDWYGRSPFASGNPRRISNALGSRRYSQASDNARTLADGHREPQAVFDLHSSDYLGNSVRDIGSPSAAGARSGLLDRGAVADGYPETSTAFVLQSNESTGNSVRDIRSPSAANGRSGHVDRGRFADGYVDPNAACVLQPSDYTGNSVRDIGSPSAASGRGIVADPYAEPKPGLVLQSSDYIGNSVRSIGSPFAESVRSGSDRGAAFDANADAKAGFVLQCSDSCGNSVRSIGSPSAANARRGVGDRDVKEEPRAAIALQSNEYSGNSFRGIGSPSAASPKSGVPDRGVDSAVSPSSERGRQGSAKFRGGVSPVSRARAADDDPLSTTLSNTSKTLSWLQARMAASPVSKQAAQDKPAFGASNDQDSPSRRALDTSNRGLRNVVDIGRLWSDKSENDPASQQPEVQTSKAEVAQGVTPPKTATEPEAAAVPHNAHGGINRSGGADMRQPTIAVVPPVGGSSDATGKPEEWPRMSEGQRTLGQSSRGTEASVSSIAPSMVVEHGHDGKDDTLSRCRRAYHLSPIRNSLGLSRGRGSDGETGGSSAPTLQTRSANLHAESSLKEVSVSSVVSRGRPGCDDAARGRDAAFLDMLSASVPSLNLRLGDDRPSLGRSDGGAAAVPRLSRGRRTNEEDMLSQTLNNTSKTLSWLQSRYAVNSVSPRAVSDTPTTISPHTPTIAKPGGASTPTWPSPRSPRSPYKPQEVRAIRRCPTPPPQPGMRSLSPAALMSPRDRPERTPTAERKLAAQAAVPMSPRDRPPPMSPRGKPPMSPRSGPQHQPMIESLGLAAAPMSPRDAPQRHPASDRKPLFSPRGRPPMSPRDRPPMSPRTRPPLSPRDAPQRERLSDMRRRSKSGLMSPRDGLQSQTISETSIWPTPQDPEPDTPMQHDAIGGTVGSLAGEASPTRPPAEDRRINGEAAPLPVRNLGPAFGKIDMSQLSPENRKPVTPCRTENGPAVVEGFRLAPPKSVSPHPSTSPMSRTAGFGFDRDDEPSTSSSPSRSPHAGTHTSRPTSRTRTRGSLSSDSIQWASEVWWNGPVMEEPEETPSAEGGQSDSPRPSYLPPSNPATPQEVRAHLEHSANLCIQSLQDAVGESQRSGVDEDVTPNGDIRLASFGRQSVRFSEVPPLAPRQGPPAVSSTGHPAMPADPLGFSFAADGNTPSQHAGQRPQNPRGPSTSPIRPETPRATIMVSGGNDMFVGTVCRKPRPKARASGTLGTGLLSISGQDPMVGTCDMSVLSATASSVHDAMSVRTVDSTMSASQAGGVRPSRGKGSFDLSKLRIQANSPRKRASLLSQSIGTSVGTYDLSMFGGPFSPVSPVQGQGVATCDLSTFRGNANVVQGQSVATCDLSTLGANASAVQGQSVATCDLSMLSGRTNVDPPMLSGRTDGDRDTHRRKSSDASPSSHKDRKASGEIANKSFEMVRIQDFEVHSFGLMQTLEVPEYLRPAFGAFMQKFVRENYPPQETRTFEWKERKGTKIQAVIIEVAVNNDQLASDGVVKMGYRQSRVAKPSPRDFRM